MVFRVHETATGAAFSGTVLLIADFFDSHICARMASAGKFVVIMEHRDGSSTACFPKSAETGLPTPKYYIQPTDTKQVPFGFSLVRLY